ncbi:hypothetical protein HpMS22_09560 [Helicobacter pylori]
MGKFTKNNFLNTFNKIKEFFRHGALEVKTIKIPFKTTQAEIPNVFSVWVLHSQNEKSLILAVIS